MPRHHHSAVDRNKLKRRLKELARIELLPALRVSDGPNDGAHDGTDVAIRARREAYGAAFDALRLDIVTIRDRTQSTRGVKPSVEAPAPPPAAPPAAPPAGN